jgi:hypothetical protein
MQLDKILKKLRMPRDRDDVPPLGTRETIAHWLLDEDHDGHALLGGSLIELVGYNKLLRVLPDRVVENLEKARLARDGRMPMLKAGLGYEELLSSIIVDGTAIASSSTEAFLAPALMLPANYLQPGGIPGRTLRLQARGRGTTLTTGATMTFKVGSALTNVIPTTTWCVSGAMAAHATAQTATMWEVESHVVVRSVGTAGTVFAMGDCDAAWVDGSLIAQTQLKFMGSAGAATPSTAAVDMTVNQFFSLTGKWSLATAYSIQAHQMLLEALN